MACLKKATPDGSITRAATWPRSPPDPFSNFWVRRIWERRITTKPRRCRPSTSACSTDNSPGGSMTVVTPTGRTGSTLSRGLTSSSVAHQLRGKFSRAFMKAAIFLAFLFLVGQTPADQPAPRTDQNSQTAHAQLLDKARKGGIDIYFEGDSITRRWGATDYPALLANWKENFFGWNAANFGWGADTIQNILWRLNNGELDNVRPKVIVLLAGTNNVGATVPPDGDEAKVADITRGIKAILDIVQSKAPDATIILTGVFPRNDNPAVMPTITKINSNISRFTDGKRIRYLNINDKLADK